MMKRIFFLCIILFLAFHLIAQTVNVNDTDLLTLGRRLKAGEIAIQGITINTPMSEALKILNKKESDYEEIESDGYKLKVSSDWEIWTLDKQMIDRIMIRNSYKGLIGKTRELMKLKDQDAFKKFLFDLYGKSDSSSQNFQMRETVITSAEFLYKEGISFELISKEKNNNKKNWSIINIISQRYYKKKSVDSLFTTRETNIPSKTSAFAFRKARWGMTKQQVIASEGEKPDYHKDHMMVFKDTLLGFPVLTVYLFDNGKLYSGKYAFTQKHTNKIIFIEDYEKVKGALVKKYGNPGNDNKFWRNDLFKDEPQRWGMAIAIGHLVLETTWKREDVKILLQLSGDNYKILFILQYNDPKFRPTEKNSDMDKL